MDNVLRINQTIPPTKRSVSKIIMKMILVVRNDELVPDKLLPNDI